MKMEYFSEQDGELDPMNGKIIADDATLTALLNSKRNASPFVFRLRGDNGFQLVCGIGCGLGCVEHRRVGGDLPYLMAVSENPPMKSGDIEFLMADTPTPIAARYIVRFDELKEIALHFLRTGERSDAVTWDSV